MRALGWPLLLSPLAAALSACADLPPAPRLLRLPTLYTGGDAAAMNATAAAASTHSDAIPAAPEIWHWVPWVALPDWMDSLEVRVADGTTGLRALPGVRWAEPLRDALPRLLTLDLAAQTPPRQLWSGALPAGLRADRVLRLQVLALDALPGQVRLLARWNLSAPPTATTTPTAPIAPTGPALQLVEAQITQPWDGSVAGLVLAQRAVLWTLAGHLVGHPGKPGG